MDQRRRSRGGDTFTYVEYTSLFPCYDACPESSHDSQYNASHKHVLIFHLTKKSAWSIARGVEMFTASFGLL